MSAEFWLYPARLAEQAKPFSAYSEAARSASRRLHDHPIADVDQYPVCARRGSRERDTRGLTVEAAIDSIGAGLDSVARTTVTRLDDFDRRRASAWSR